MDIRQLRYFVSVASHESIAKAAIELCISQSPLSRQIKALEDDIGFKLFDRHNKRLILNAAGSAFLLEANALISQFNDLHGFKSKYSEENNNLKIGYVDSIIFEDKFHTGLQLLKKKNITVNMFSMKTKEQISALRENRLDLALTYHLTRACNGIKACNFGEDILSLIVPMHHPLARCKDITVDNLENACWIAQPRLPNIAERENFLAACLKLGFTPNIRFEASTPLSVVSLVEKGFGIGLLQKKIADHYAYNIKVFDLAWFPMTVKTDIVWRQDNPAPLVRDALEVFLNPA